MNKSIFFGESKVCSQLKCQLSMMKVNFRYDGGVKPPLCYLKRRFTLNNDMNVVAMEAEMKMFNHKYLLN